MQKFGLKESEVQSVFEEGRKERQAEMKTRFEDRLTQEVKDGKLTEAQKRLLIAKHNELQAKREADRPENWQSLTREERKTKMEAERQALEAWAKANGIDSKYFFNCFGYKGFGRGR